MAICIGLNSVDPAHYAGWSGPLAGCENDASDMLAIANANGFASEKLLTRDATREAVLGKIAAAAKDLKAGGIFMISYSGHGGQYADGNGDEADGLDETWCLYNGEMADTRRWRSSRRVFACSSSPTVATAAR